MRLVLRRAAKRDLAEARRWYDDRRPGLGQDFLSCVEVAFAKIREHPLMFPRVDPQVRRARTERFPFGVFYMVDGETLRVLAVLHRARSSEWWQSRVTGGEGE